jgi:ElaB/YqjD/DUF883 family membrane-anchored ribosome-binding protein
MYEHTDTMRFMMNRSQELERLTNHAQGLLGEVADDQSPQVQELRTRVNQTVEFMMTEISKVNTVALDVLRYAASSADDCVRENPWVAIGAIAAAAALLGFLAG